MIRREQRILYVDDTVEQRYAMRRILEREGYHTLEAGTGSEALAALQPELLAIILDVKLPDMSGYEVCRRIKRDATYGSIPVIQVSASFADPDHRAIGLSGGADAYIAQPVHPQELLNLVRSLVQSSHAERMARFMAQLGPRITRSLDLQTTVRAIEAAVVPYFADACRMVLNDEEAALSPALERVAQEVRETGVLRLHASGEQSVLGAPLQISGKPLGLVLFMLDGDARAYNEADLVYAGDMADRFALAIENAQLYTAQLATQNALVQSEKLAAAARLSAAIAHELNNPLEAITNLLFLIETGTDVPDVTRNYAREASSELARLSHITRQTLGFYRELTTAQEFDLSESVQETLALYSRRLGKRSIRMEATFEPELRVTAIKGEIRQVISNLMVNAMDAMDAMEWGECETPVLSIRTCSAQGEAVVSVQDNGPGIAEGVKAHIFEPFFTTKPGTGTGLGLWVSERIMRNHNGRLTVETHTDGSQRGTVFSAVLPL